VNEKEIARAGLEGDFDRAYHEFRRVFDEAREKVAALRGGRGEGGFLVAGDINSKRMSHLADQLENLHEAALDAADNLRRVDPETRQKTNELYRAVGAVTRFEDDCRMYASYLRARGDPEFLDEGELARLGYLPQTRSHYIQGQKTTWRDALKNLFRVVILLR